METSTKLAICRIFLKACAEDVPLDYLVGMLDWDETERFFKEYVAELAADEEVALRLSRGEWDKLFKCVRVETPDGFRLSEDYYGPLRKLRHMRY
jgi:hypothetical protein